MRILRGKNAGKSQITKINLNSHHKLTLRYTISHWSRHAVAKNTSSCCPPLDQRSKSLMLAVVGGTRKKIWDGRIDEWCMSDEREANEKMAGERSCNNHNCNNNNSNNNNNNNSNNNNNNNNNSNNNNNNPSSLSWVCQPQWKWLDHIDFPFHPISSSLLNSWFCSLFLLITTNFLAAQHVIPDGRANEAVLRIFFPFFLFFFLVDKLSPFLFPQQTFWPRSTWYQTEDPPKSMWKSV